MWNKQVAWKAPAWSARSGRYAGNEVGRRFVAWAKECGIPLHYCHTSGHASIAALHRLRDALPDAIAVPVHLADREGFEGLFDKVQLHEDREWWNA